MTSMSLELGASLQALVSTGASAFSPSDLSGLGVWYNENGKTTDSRGALTQWNDQSGNGRNLASSDTGGYQIEAGHPINGLDATFFKGDLNGAHLESGWTPSGNDIYLAARVRRDRIRSQVGSGSSVRPFASFGDNNLSIGTQNNNTAAAEVIRVWDGTTVTNSANSSWQAGEFATIIMQFQGGTSFEVWLRNRSSGVLDKVIDVGAANPTLGELWIGKQDYSIDNSRLFPGYVAEIIVGEGVLTSDERDDLNDYLNRWNSGRTATAIYGWTSAADVIVSAGAGQAVARGDGFIFITEGDTGGEIRWHSDTGLSFKGARSITSDHTGGANTPVGMDYDTGIGKLFVSASSYPTTPDDSWVFAYDFNPAGNGGLGELTFDTGFDVRSALVESVNRLPDGNFVVAYGEDPDVDIVDSGFDLVRTVTLASTYAADVTTWQSSTVQDSVVYFTPHGNNEANRDWMVGYLYEDGNLYEAFPYIGLPATDCNQGSANEGSTWLFAQRNGGLNFNNNDVLRATPQTYTVDAG